MNGMSSITMLPSDEPRVGIIVLNWNSWRETIDCLASLAKIDYHNFSIFLVDNGSKDGSLEHILASLGDTGMGAPEAVIDMSVKSPADAVIDVFRSDKVPRLMVLANHQNSGFAGGNNLVLPFLINGRYDYVLLLNNDTIVAPNLLGELVAGARRNPDGGFFGPLVLYHDYSGRTDVINFAGGVIDLRKGVARHRGMNEVDTGQFAVDEKVDYIEGSCLLMPLKLFQGLGGFNERFFAYWEENDLELRGANQGFASYLIPTTRIWHKVSRSSSSSVRSYYFARNRLWLIRLHADWSQIVFFIPYYFCIMLPYEIVSTFRKGGAGTARRLIKGIVDGLLSPAKDLD